ncbi:MAG: phosphoglycerate dehydrogenase [Sphingomonadales bacterium]|nr:phosphoglycerate dehydrogenase [Sphingomonadales bacterium]
MQRSQVTSYPKDKIKILFLENVSDAAVKKFRSHGYTQVEKINRALNESQLIDAIRDVHILGIRSKTTITDSVLAAAKKLQAIGCFCIGVNQIDLRAATQRGVAVFNAPYSNTRSVAELVIGASIMLLRGIPEKNNAAHKGIWQKEAKGSREMRGKTMGIVGYGNIGSQVSVMAESLGMRVLFFDIENKLPLGNASACRSLKELVSKSDIITLHVPETTLTHQLINKQSLRQCKKGAILINYARGQVVDLKALEQSLQSGHIAGAAIDVYPWEPEKNGDLFSCPLQNLPNVLLTPHIGGSTEEAQQNIGEDVSVKLFQYLETGFSDGSHTIPPISLPSQTGAHRILHIHKNVPGVLSAINSALSSNNINIIGQYLKTNDLIGYVILDIDHKISAKALSILRDVPGSIRVRMLY